MMFADGRFLDTCQVHSVSRRIRLVLAGYELLAACGLCALILAQQM